MSDLIKLLPENVANQIAAGEVVQRPASIVKELLENAVDAKATKIRLNIKDAGRLLVQVCDNGCGMSETDARMCFERHATSKIQKAEDLFSINTFGFRGEALSSIAAVAQVEMRTRRDADELGTTIKIDGSKFVSQEPCTCDVGTVISVKNLFFNIPARRSFLKSNVQELKQIVAEFVKVALINPTISFSLYNNDSMMYELMSENFRQRIINLVNKSYNEKLIPIEAETENIKISGYIGKPEAAKKTRNTDQFFFVNGRFIKHSYLKHAVETSYQELLPAETFPMFFIVIDIDPKLIDVNIHPTKTEINFQDAHILYAILKSAAKHSIGKYSLNVPSLDFDIEPSFMLTNEDNKRPIVQPKVTYDPSYNPFGGMTDNSRRPASDEWKNFYNDINNQFESIKQQKSESSADTNNSIQSLQESIEIKDITSSNTNYKSEKLFDFTEEDNDNEENNKNSHFYQLGEIFIQSKNKYIIGAIKSGLIIIDQSRASERIIYEKTLKLLESDKISAQIDIFPETITVSYDDGIILDESKDTFEKMGFRIEKMNQNNYIIQAHPENITSDEIKPFFEEIFADIKSGHEKKHSNKIKVMARATAKRTSVKQGEILTNEEMCAIAKSLAKCTISDVDLDGRPIFVIMDINAVEKMF